ncbi:hypothetical protein G159_04920 [Planococcus glaciei CHR43]|nr:hypothetical protein [Planococcus glaciei]ETP69869.1 hypothetical protein G159_04920 [Planococcus glaciei CHR43]
MNDFAIDLCSAFIGQEVYNCGDLRRLSTTSCSYDRIEEAGVRLINIVARCVGCPVAKNLTRCALDRLHHLVSYIPLHDKAVETAKAGGLDEIQKDQKKSKTLNAMENIQKPFDRNQLGFKRKYIRS